MKRSWLKPFALVMTVTAIAAVIGWIVAAYRATDTIIVLKYIKPIGMHEKAPPPNPAAKFRSSSEYLVAVTSNCKVPQWQLRYAGLAQDADDESEVEVPSDRISDRQFDCLSSFVVNPLVTLQRVTR